jgi:hypothetical protein
LKLESTARNPVADPKRPFTACLRQAFARAEALVPAQAQSIAPDGSASNTFQSTGFIVNCPLISIFRQPVAS